MWLDVPWRVAGWRIVKRHVLADVHRTNQHPGYRRLWKFLVWSRWFYTAGPEDADAGAPQDTRWGALQLLEGYREKLICTAASGLALELVGGRSRFQR